MRSKRDNDTPSNLTRRKRIKKNQFKDGDYDSDDDDDEFDDEIVDVTQRRQTTTLDLSNVDSLDEMAHRLLTVGKKKKSTNVT